MKNIKKYILTALIIILAIIIIIITVATSSVPNYPGINDGAGDEVLEKSLIFSNRDLLSKVYNKDISSIILTNIDSIVFSEQEMKYSKDNSPAEGDPAVYFDAKINTSSLVSYNTETHFFTVSLSDKRQYDVFVTSDTTEDNFTYVYTAITRNGSSSTINIIINGAKQAADNFINFITEKTTSSNKTDITYISLSDLLN